MAKKKRTAAPPPRVRLRSDAQYDVVELSDEDLEVVVGGLSDHAATAHARTLGIIPMGDSNPFNI